MGVLDNVKDFAKSVGDKTSAAIETTKLNSKISSEQNAINAVMKQIGEFYYSKYTEMGTADEGIAGFCATIDAHNAAIAQAKTEIERIKTKNTATAAASDPVSTNAGDRICPACGKENPSGMNFCGACGAKFE
jgi:Zn finger protein HypA/HybF involved in hydrogenase expression